MNILNWAKKLNAIVAGYDADLKAAHTRIAKLEAVIRERTDISVDVGFKTASHVIVTGRYKNTDYVQTFALDTPDLASLIDRLREMERYGTVRRVDGPPMVREVFKREVFKREFNCEIF